MTTDDGCPECTGALAREGDETICTDCGLVVDADRLDRGPEWRSFQGEETNRERTGAPLTRSRHDRGLSTEIGHGDGSGSVRLTGRKRRRLVRMRREHSRAQIATKQDRNKVYSYTEIRRLVDRLELPQDVCEQACALFDSAQSAELLQGRSLEGFAAATVYAVCRTRSISRTIDEVVADARADESELRAAYDALNRELGLPTGPIDPAEYVPRFASALDLPDAIERRALELAALGREAAIAGGRDPSGFAAGCLYTAAQDCGHGLTQCDAADAAGVSPVTLRKAYHDLEDAKATEVTTSDGAPEDGTASDSTVSDDAASDATGSEGTAGHATPAHATAGEAESSDPDADVTIGQDDPAGRSKRSGTPAAMPFSDD
ncbi:transcription initiation factor TFB [Salinarchaeum sp. Harcht-Bsk1]|nr:transcription initiation factor TFB [Salinarchaeum sp. Harcht-Bsk1]